MLKINKKEWKEFKGDRIVYSSTDFITNQIVLLRCLDVVSSKFLNEEGIDLEALQKFDDSLVTIDDNQMQQALASNIGESAKVPLHRQKVIIETPKYDVCFYASEDNSIIVPLNDSIIKKYSSSKPEILTYYNNRTMLLLGDLPDPMFGIMRLNTFDEFKEDIPNYIKILDVLSNYAN